MIKLVIVKNPFQVWKDRVIKEIMPGATLRQMADSAGFVGMEINCTVNGNVIEAEDYKIPDNNIVVMSPVVGKSGKSILSIVAMIGLTIATGAIAGGAFSGMGAAFKAGALGAQLMAAATMTIGSLLINKYLTPKADMGSFGGENNPTYSWGGVQTMEGQNNPITMTYGKVLSGGQTIGKSVTVENDDEYLNWLVAAGEGELDISNIKLNDNPIENYNDVTVETRRGTNDQDIIPYFNDTYSTQNLSYQLLDSEVVHTVNGNATEKVIVKIEFSNGLYYAENNGDLGKAWVEICGWIRKKNTTEWAMFFSQKIEGNQSSALRKEFASEELMPGQYEVKLKVNDRQYPVDSNRASTRVWWTALTSVVHDDFTYPNIALIGIKAKATDQLSGTPSLSFIKERKKVWVYNPYLQAYEQKDANNPAWAAYDMLHLCSRLKNINTGEYEYDARGCSKDILIYDQFHEWAEFCESKRMRVNVEICQAGEILDIINKEIACIGRGSVIRFGTRYGCIWDCVKQPVQMFGMGNIIAGTFNEEFLQTSDRANAVEVTYTDAAMDYNRNTITIYSDTYDSEATEKVTQVTLNGVTDYEQAYREGKFQLYCNKYLLRTVDFDASVDAIACTVGDCILVSHDVPQWGHSGRIHSVQGNVLELPVEIEDVSKQYRIMYRTENDVIHTSDVSIVSVADGWTTVELMATLQPDELPAVNDIFDLAVANVGTKPFVVKSITRSSDFVRKISCIEYHEAVYNEDYDIPPVNYSVPDIGVSNVTNLVVRQTKTIGADGGYQYKIDANWEYDKSGTFVVYGSYDGENYTLLANGINEHEFSAMTYTRMLLFRVVTKNGLRTSSGVVANVELIDKIVIPKCSGIEAYTKYREMSDDIVRYDIEVTWTPPASDAYKQAQVWYKTNGTQCNNLGIIPEGVAVSELGFNGNWIFAGIGINSVVIPQAIIGETYKIAVCSQDVYGNTEHPALSPQKEIIVAKKTETPDTPANVSITVTDTFNISWDEVRNADVKYYEVRKDNNVGRIAGLIARTTETSCSVNNVSERSGNIYVFAVGAIGNASNPAIITYNKPIPNIPALANVVSKLQGLAIGLQRIPGDCIKINLKINNELIELTESSYYYPCSPGVYSVSYAFVDYFGEGGYSVAVSAAVEAYIPPELLAAETFNYERMSENAKQAIADASTDNINVAVKGILGNGAAMVMQPDGYAIVTSDGQKLTGLFADEAGTLRLQGDYIHLTGNTVFDENVIIKGHMQSGSVSCDDGVSIAAGAVTINENGMQVQCSNGTQVSFNGAGMQFVDNNGNVFGTIGRFKAGTCKHNEVVALNWDVPPKTVLMMPSNLKTYAQGYDNVYVKCFADNITATNFKCQCYTTAAGGSANSITTASNVARITPSTSGQETRTLTTTTNTYNIPTGATLTNLSIDVSAEGFQKRMNSGGYLWTFIYLMGLYLDVYVNGELSETITLVQGNAHYYDDKYSGTATAAIGHPSGARIGVRSRLEYVVNDISYGTREIVLNCAAGKLTPNITGDTVIATGEATYFAFA